jgi:hypothetical protein
MWELTKVDAFECRLRAITGPQIQSFNWDKSTTIPSFFSAKIPLETWPTLGAFCIILLLSRNYHLRDLPFIKEEEDFEFPRSPIWHKIAIELDTILQFSYWQRAWILQEIVCSTNPIINFGRHTMSFSTLAAAAYNFRLHYDTCCSELGSKAHQRDFTLWSSLQSSFAHIRRISDLREDTTSDADNKPLFKILTGFCGALKATDPRDLVYGLTGVVMKHGGRLIPADYSIGLVEAYSKTAAAILDDEKSLEVFSYSERGHAKAHNLPSWVPDFGFGWKAAPFDKFYHRFMAAKDHRCESELENDLCLRVRSVMVDKVSKIGPGGIRSAAYISEVVRTLQECQTLAGVGDVDADGQAPGDISEESFWRTIFGDCIEVSGSATRLGDRPRDARRKFARVFDFEKEHEDVYHTKYERLGPEELNQIRAWYQWLKEKSDSSSGSPWTDLCSTDEQANFQYFTSTYRYFTNFLKFFVSQQGRIGLGPSSFLDMIDQTAVPDHISLEDLEVGDEIHIIHGSKVPLVLRKLDTDVWKSCIHQQSKVYKLIGACYVNGIMDGEALDSLGAEACVIYLR